MIYRFSIYEHYNKTLDIEAESQDAALAWMERQYGDDERTLCDPSTFDHGYGGKHCQCGYEITEVLKEQDDKTITTVHLNANGYEDDEEVMD